MISYSCWVNFKLQKEWDEKQEWYSIGHSSSQWIIELVQMIIAFEVLSFLKFIFARSNTLKGFLLSNKGWFMAVKSCAGVNLLKKTWLDASLIYFLVEWIRLDYHHHILTKRIFSVSSYRSLFWVLAGQCQKAHLKNVYFWELVVIIDKKTPQVLKPQASRNPIFV